MAESQAARPTTIIRANSSASVLNAIFFIPLGLLSSFCRRISLVQKPMARDKQQPLPSGCGNAPLPHAKLKGCVAWYNTTIYAKIFNMVSCHKNRRKFHAKRSKNRILRIKKAYKRDIRDTPFFTSRPSPQSVVRPRRQGKAGAAAALAAGNVTSLPQKAKNKHRFSNRRFRFMPPRVERQLRCTRTAQFPLSDRTRIWPLSTAEIGQWNNRRKSANLYCDFRSICDILKS